jgi:DNA-binding transcriptional MerR regulator
MPQTPAPDQGYAAPDVTKIIGISYRQLDYWARTKLVVPSVKDAEGSGSQRRYSFQDLLKLKVVKSLLDAGVSLQKIRQATDTLEGLDEPAHGTTLISDGDHVYAEASPDALLDLLKNGQAVFAIAVDKVWTDLEKSVGSTRRKRTARAAGS